MPRPKTDPTNDPDMKAIRRAVAPAPAVKQKEQYLSTGITPLNLILSGRPTAGLVKGRYYHLVGESGSGKTALALQVLAEAARSKAFADYDLVYDGPEFGLGMDIASFFGRTAADRIRPVKGDWDAPEFSVYLEDFGDHLDALYRTNRPFIYVLDSMDAVEPKEDVAKDEKRRGKRLKGQNEGAGSYGGAKPKMNGVLLRRAANLMLPKTGSILIVVSQMRDIIPKPGQIVLPGADTKTYSGGHPLKFYCSGQIWMTVGGQIRKKANGKEWKVGEWTKFRVKKNRGTGRPYTAEVPFLYSVGFDDLAGCVQFLLDVNHWKGPKNDQGKAVRLPTKMPATPEFPDFDGGSADAFIRHVEDNNLEPRLRKLVGDVWQGIEAELATERKPRYV